MKQLSVMFENDKLMRI